MNIVGPPKPFPVTVNSGEFPSPPGERWSSQNAKYLQIGEETVVYNSMTSRDGCGSRTIIHGIQKTPEISIGGGVKKVDVLRIIDPDLKKQLKGLLTHLEPLEFR
jgi:hypothetical protein